MEQVDTVDAHANTPQKRKRCPDEASTEPWSVAKSDMTVTSDMGRWEKADLDDSLNEEELLTEELEDMLDKAYGRRPTPTPTPSPPSWVAPLQEDQDSQVLADLPKPANPTEAVSINSPEATTSRNALLDHLGKELVAEVKSMMENTFGIEIPDSHVSSWCPGPRSSVQSSDTSTHQTKGIKGSKGGKGGTISLMEELKQKKQRIEARIQRQAILVDEVDQKQAQAKLQPPPPLHRLAPITQDAGTAAESSVSKIK